MLKVEFFCINPVETCFSAKEYYQKIGSECLQFSSSFFIELFKETTSDRAVQLSFFRVRSVIGRLFKNSVGIRLSVGYL